MFYTDEEQHRAFENFLSGFALIPALLKVAKERVCLIEVVVIQTAFIDAMLRMAIILKKQLDNKSSELDFRYLCQPDGTRNFVERQIYREAESCGVVSSDMFQALEALYEKRNRTIHRLFISEVKYTELVPLTVALDDKIVEIHNIVYDFEQEQIKTGVGMTRAADELSPEFSDDAWKQMFLKKL